MPCFLRWIGGKRWLAPSLSGELSKLGLNCYHEPFVGSGAVFFALQPDTAVLSDINVELINAYKTVKKSPRQLLARLQYLPSTREVYERVRRQEAKDPITRGAQFIYLNRVGFGGIHRVNRNGQFNVPFGGRSHKFLESRGIIEKASKVLRGARLQVCDFEHAFAKFGKEDVAFCDPCYYCGTNSDRFTRYNATGFGAIDHMRLGKCVDRAVDRGSDVVTTELACNELADWYSQGIVIFVGRRSGIRRAVQDEAIILRGLRVGTMAFAQALADRLAKSEVTSSLKIERVGRRKT